MAIVTINGIQYKGNNISIKNDRIVIDGVEVGSSLPAVSELRIVEGQVNKLETDHSVKATDCYIGEVDAGGSVTCDDVGGSVNAGGSVTANDIKGSANAGGSVTCKIIGGSAMAGGSIRHGC